MERNEIIKKVKTKYEEEANHISIKDGEIIVDFIDGNKIIITPGSLDAPNMGDENED